MARMRASAEASIGEMAGVAGRVIEECDHILNLVNTLLEISETEAGTQVSSVSQFIVLILIGVGIFSPIGKEKGIIPEIGTGHGVAEKLDAHRLARHIVQALQKWFFVGIHHDGPMFLLPQARGETVTAAGDMYSLGLLIQDFFTGSSPYQDNLSNSALLFKAMNADTLPLQGVDAQLTRLVNALKSPNAQDRPTAGMVVEELDRILNRPKRRLKILAIAGFITVLCLGTILSTIGFVKAKRSAKQATQAQAQSDAVNDFLRTTLSAASPYELGIDVKVRDVLAHASEHIMTNFGDDPLMRAAVHHTLGHTYTEMGSYEDARQHLEQAKKLREEQLGIDHRETLNTLHRLGILLGKQGELDQAESLLENVLERYRVTMGPESRELLSAMTSLSTVYLDKKDYPKAEAICRKNLAISRATLGPDDAHTASSLNGLAIVLCNQGRFSEGESLFRETLAIKRKKLGDAHPSTLDAMHNLASALHVQKKYKLAEPIIRETLQLTSRIMGPEHPSTLKTRNNLALTLAQLDKNQEAEQLLRENLALDKKILGEDHRSTLSTQNNLGMALFHLKRFAEAEILFRDTLEKRRLTLPPDHPDIPSSLENVANALAWQKKFDEAKPLYGEALTLNTSAYGKGHPTTIALGCKLATTLLELGQNDKAIELIQKTRDQSEESLGPDHVLTVELRALYEQWAPDGEE